MNTTRRMDDIRRETLSQVARSEKYYKIFVGCAALMEGGCLLGFFLLMDFDERLHWLLLVMTGLIYGTLAFGMCALGAYVRHGMLRILAAIEIAANGQAANPAED